MSASSPLPPSKRASIGFTVEWLPKYAPELNDIEVVWHDLKAHNLAHYTFTDAADLDRAIHQAVQALNNERSRNPLVELENLSLVQHGSAAMPVPSATGDRASALAP